MVRVHLWPMNEDGQAISIWPGPCVGMGESTFDLQHVPREGDRIHLFLGKVSTWWRVVGVDWQFPSLEQYPQKPSPSCFLNIVEIPESKDDLQATE